MSKEIPINKKLFFVSDNVGYLQNINDNEDLFGKYVNIKIYDTELTINKNNKIKVFKKNYNENYIKNFPEKERELIKSGLNSTLQLLIDNLKIKNPTYMVDYILGPFCYFKLIRSDIGKTFYLFGEIHREKTERSDCPYNGKKIQFIEYIKRLSKETPSFIDIYFELGLIMKNESKYLFSYSEYVLEVLLRKLVLEIELNNQLPEISFFEKLVSFSDETKDSITSSSYTAREFKKIFTDCIQPSTRDADKCKLMRIHLIDTRRTYNNINIQMTDYFAIIFKLLNLNFEVKFCTILIIIKYTGAIDFLKELIKNESFTFNNFLNIIQTNKNIKNEIKRTYMKNEILNFIESEFNSKFSTITKNKIVQNINKCIELINILLETNCYDLDKNIYNNYSKNIIKYLKYLNFELGMLMTDLYGLCRIFKYYSKSKQYIEPESKTNETQPIESTNVIYYGGANHTKRIRKFLIEKYGCSEVYTNENSQNCVKLNRLEQKPADEYSIMVDNDDDYLESETN